MKFTSKKRHFIFLSMKMVGGRVIALPQKEQVKTGPLINEPLHYPLPTGSKLALVITCSFIKMAPSWNYLLLYNIGRQQKHVKKNLCKTAFCLIRSLFVVPLYTVQLAQCITIQRADISTPQPRANMPIVKQL